MCSRVNLRLIMVSETTPVNVESGDLDTFGRRLVAERERLRMKQVEVCAIGGVSKTTQIKYEANERSPDAIYLSRLSVRGFDVSYLLTGDRTSDSLDPELQNLIDAYQDAAPALREAAFAVLLSPLLDKVRLSRTVPGYAKHELCGEESPRYKGTSNRLGGEAGALGPLEGGDETFSGSSSCQE